MATILVIICMTLGAIALAGKSKSTSAQVAEERKRELEAEEQLRCDHRMERHKQFLAAQTHDWAYVDAVRMGPDEGFLAIDAKGASFRLAIIGERGDEFFIVADEVIAVSAIRSISIAQPMKPLTTTRVSRVPVAVQKQKNTIGRAVVGGVLAGPVGALVGGISAGHGETTVERHDTHHTETTYVKSDPVLVIATGSFDRPAIRLKFEDVKILNVWSARLWAARGW
jgi:hypothetical protein